MFGLSGEQVGGLVRTILTTIGGAVGMYIVSKGWVSQELVTQLMGWATTAIVTLVVAWWSAQSKTQANLAVSVAAIPNTTVITTPAIAAATPDSPNVMSNLDAKAVAK